MGFKLFSKQKQTKVKIPVDSNASIMKIKQNLELQEKRYVSSPDLS